LSNRINTSSLAHAPAFDGTSSPLSKLFASYHGHWTPRLGEYLPNCSTLVATRNVFLFTETYWREYRCQVCAAGSPRSTITAINVSARGRKPRLRALYRCKGLQKPDDLWVLYSKAWQSADQRICGITD